MKDFFGEDLCAAAAQAYMESLLSGESGAKASEAAEIAYKAAWRAGARVEPGSPCATAEASFRSSYDSGKDTVTNAALAFAKSWPGLEEGNPCSVSTKTYMESIIGGKSIDDAWLSAAKAFIGAFADLANSGNAVVDASCSKAAKSFIRNSNGPDSAASDAAQAFIDATLSSRSDGYDPVCTDAALAYMEAYADGKDQLTSTLIAAKTFYKSYTSGNPPNPSSPCVKANLAFAAKSPLSDSKSNAAMAAFIDKAVEDGNAVADPVCAAATLAFLDAKIAKRSDKEAGSAACRIDWNVNRQKENEDPESRPGSSLGQAAQIGSVKNLSSGYIAKSKSTAAVMQDEIERGRPKQKTVIANGWTKEQYDAKVKQDFLKSQEVKTNKVKETIQTWGRRDSSATGRTTPAPSRHIGEGFSENKVGKTSEVDKNANSWRTKTPEPTVKLVNVSVEKAMGSNQNIHISENAQKQMANFMTSSSVQQKEEVMNTVMTNTMSSQSS